MWYNRHSEMEKEMGIMLRHTTRVDKRVIVKPVNKIINDEIVTVRKDEFPLNVLVVTMQDKVNSQDDIRELAAAIYPKAQKAIGKDNYMAGVEIQLEDVIKVLLHKDDSLPAFEKAMLREYVSQIELPNVINGKNGNSAGKN